MQQPQTRTWAAAWRTARRATAPAALLPLVSPPGQQRQQVPPLQVSQVQRAQQRGQNRALRDASALAVPAPPHAQQVAGEVLLQQQPAVLRRRRAVWQLRQGRSRVAVRVCGVQGMLLFLACPACSALSDALCMAERHHSTSVTGHARS